MVYLSQKDLRWGGKPIGNSKSLIKDFGCTITSISMASDYFGCFQNPGWMAKNLLFAVDKVIWSSIRKVLCFGFEWRYYYHDQVKFAEAIKNLKKVCLLEIKKKHWVIALKKIPGGYWVADPWDSRRKFMLNSSVSGGSVLIKNL